MSPLEAKLAEIRDRANAIHSEVITDPQSAFWLKVGISQRDVKTLLAIVEVQARALEKVARADCPKYMAHPQSVWWVSHVQPVAGEAQAKVSALLGEGQLR